MLPYPTQPRSNPADPPACPCNGPCPAPFFFSCLQEIIAKENNFQQPGERFRSWDPARQERFLKRFADMMADPRCTPGEPQGPMPCLVSGADGCRRRCRLLPFLPAARCCRAGRLTALPVSLPVTEVRNVWLGYWSQADASLGQRLASKLQQMNALHSASL